MGSLIALLLAQQLSQPSSMNLNEKPIIVKDEGVKVGSSATTINCTGAGISCTKAANTMIISVAGGGGGGGGGNFVEASLALTGTGYYSVAVTGQAWVTSTSQILCEPFGTTADGLTPEVIAVSGVRATAANRVAATGFDLLVFNPNGLVGTVRFHCTGA